MKEKLNQYISKSKVMRSLKFRIFFIILLVGIVPTTILRYGILQNYEKRAVDLRISDVQTQFKILADHLITYNYLKDPSSELINAELDQLSNLYDGRVLIVDSNFNVVKDSYGISQGKTIISEEVIRCFKGESITNYDSVNQFIEMTTPISIVSEEDMGEGAANQEKEKMVVRGVMLTSVSTDSIAANISILNRRAVIIQFLMIIVLVGMAWGLSNILVEPFERVSSAISKVKEGFQNEPVSVPDYLETEHIVTAFNELLGRMKVLDESRQEFVSNVSHELKTPITSMKVLADSLIAQEDAPLELYKEFMTDIADEIERENKVINDLLSLVKMDKTAANLNIELIDINALCELILKRLRPIAKQRDIDVILESKREVNAEVDEVKLTLAISNLVENAIKYNNDHGFVKVTLDADHQFFSVEVTDNGLGIPQEALEHIFERFYRVDKSHSREIGGTGLGLSITRGAILMHRGFIKVESEEGSGTTFLVKIPLTYIAK
ncbi:MAG: cell wall metabolism sensor histidine kinase WalK [Lachnospiraceae bacterium]|nr:cell wall metabolism sensor histidine kinase WalK [Lachnospiraceae bacterium]